MSAIFISHSSKDYIVSAQFRERLAAQGHRSVFLDFDPEYGIPAGRDWEQELYQQLRACQAVIVLCSQHSMISKWCFAEITHAKSLGKHIFPIKVDDCQVEQVLTAHQVLDLTTEPEEAYNQLWRGLKRAGLDPADAFDWDGSRPPYPGLLAFQEADAAVFFGRDAEIQQGLELLNRLRQFGGARTMMVLGASGSGKSSLVRAGLLPRLRRNEEQWLVLPPFRPQENPLQELAIVLAAAFQKHGKKVAWEDVWNTLQPATEEVPVSSEILVQLVRDLGTMTDRREASVLLVIDQTEELLTANKGAEASQFLHLLQAAFETPNSPLMAICTLRSDFLGVFQQHPSSRELAYEVLRVGPMSADRFVQVIVAPAEKAGIKLETGLTEIMLEDTKTESALPLLAFTLRELYERYNNKGILTVEAYRDKLGGLAGSVAKAAEAVFDAKPLDESEVANLRKSFLSMVQINEEGQYARRTSHWEDLPLQVHPLLERFVKARLLVSLGETNEKILEVAHEELFRSWDRLKGWLDEDREFLLWRNRLSEAYQEWKRTEQSPDALLRGALLSEAVRWLSLRPEDLKQNQQIFIQESAALKERELEEEKARQQRELEAERQRAEEQAAASRRFRRLAYVLTAVLLLAIGAAVFATIQQKQAETQRRRALALQLAAQADARLDNTGEGLELSLLLATESLKSTWTPEGYGAWARAVALLPRRPTIWIDTQGSTTRNLVFHPTKPWLAILSDDRMIRIKNVQNGSVIKDFPFQDVVEYPKDSSSLHLPGAIPGFQFSPDGRWLAAVSNGGLAIWDTETWQRQNIPTRNDGFFDLAFNSTSELLAFAGYHLPMRILSTGTWKDQIPNEAMNTTDSWRFSKSSIDFSPRHLVSAEYGESQGVKFWELQTEQNLLKEIFYVEISDRIRDLSFSHKGDALVFLTAANGLRYWSKEVLEKVVSNASPLQVRIDEFERDTDSWSVISPGARIVYSPDDRYLLTSGASTVQLWDSKTGRELARIPHWGLADFNTHGDLIAIGGSKVGLWSIPNRSSAATLEHISEAKSVAFSPDGLWLATGQQNGEVRVFHTGSWEEEVNQKLAHEVSFVAFTPDSKWLVTEKSQKNQTELSLFRVGSWEALPPMLHEDQGLTIEISPDGQYLKTKTPANVDRYEGLKRASRTRIWEISTATEVAWLSHEDVDESPNNKKSITEGTLPLGQGGSKALLDQAENWSGLRESLPDSIVPSRLGRASQDGHWLVSLDGSQMGVALLEPSTRREIVVLQPEYKVEDVDFDPNGRWLATASGNTVDIWLLGPVEELVKESCARLSRNFTLQEWNTYLGNEFQKTCGELPGPEIQVGDKK